MCGRLSTARLDRATIYTRTSTASTVDKYKRIPSVAIVTATYCAVIAPPQKRDI